MLLFVPTQHGLLFWDSHSSLSALSQRLNVTLSPISKHTLALVHTSLSTSMAELFLCLNMLSIPWFAAPCLLVSDWATSCPLAPVHCLIYSRLNRCFTWKEEAINCQCFSNYNMHMSYLGLLLKSIFSCITNWKVWKCQWFSHAWLFAIAWTIVHQDLSMGLPRQEYWSG